MQDEEGEQEGSQQWKHSGVVKELELLPWDGCAR